MTQSFNGVHAAMVTPFDRDGKVDVDGYQRLVDHLLTQEVHGLVVNGSTGEFASLTLDERQQGVEAVIRAAAGRCPITVQVGAMTTAEAVIQTRHALDVGADMVLVVSPYYEGLAEREIEGYYTAVAAVGLPVIIYNNPASTGWSMTPEFIARLAGIDGVDYVKDTTGDIRRFYRIDQECGDKLGILISQDTLTFAGFLSGATGTIWGATNAIPAACVRLWELTVKDNDLGRARELWKAMYPVNRFFEEEGYVAAIREAMRLVGVDVGSPRLPMLPLAADQSHRLERLLSRLEHALELAT